MAAVKKKGKLQSAFVQFGYEHKKLQSHLVKIRKNTEELIKMMGSIDKNKR